MTDNPYQPPAADVQPPNEPIGDISEPRRVPAGRGVAWFAEGITLFMKAPGPFIAITVVMYAATFVAALVPLVGTLAVTLFWPHLMAGYYLALEHAHHGSPVAVGDLFAPFQEKAADLLGVGLFYLVGSVVMTMTMLIIIFAGLGLAGLETVLSGEPDPGQLADSQTILLTILLAFLVALALLVPMMMAFIYAPLLVYRHELPTMDALRESFRGCLRNMLPFLLWGLVWLAVFVLAMILVFIPIIGWLLLIFLIFLVTPLSFASLYVAYREIYA